MGLLWSANQDLIIMDLHDLQEMLEMKVREREGDAEFTHVALAHSLKKRILAAELITHPLRGQNDKRRC